VITALRDYQERGVQEIRAAYAAGAQSVLYTLPTGGGKTVVFSFVAKSAAAKGKRVGILVHRDALLRQSSRALSACGVPHGLIAPGHYPTRDLVQVASVQTLVRRLDKYHFDLLVPDEAHHATAGSWHKVISAYPLAHILGVTATPARLDGRGLAEIFEAMVLGPTISELIAQGHLCRPVVYGSERRLELARIAVRGGDYARGQLAMAMDSTTITGDAIAQYSKHCPGVPAVAFCVSVRHAQDVAAQFDAAGYRAAVIHGSMPIEDIRAAVEGLASGRVQVLTSCDLISEGFDCPVIQAAILLRPTKSEALYIQQVGRALRPSPGKDRAFILDHADNWLLHGSPAAGRDWSLEGAKKRKNAGGGIPVRQCPKCFACHVPTGICPECGHVYVPEPVRAPEQAAGELAEIPAEVMEAMKRRKKDMIRRARTLEELQEVGRQLRYKPGWASILYQQRGGRI
jgi:DNA repair protein RadD